MGAGIGSSTAHSSFAEQRNTQVHIFNPSDVPIARHFDAAVFVLRCAPCSGARKDAIAASARLLGCWHIRLNL